MVRADDALMVKRLALHPRGGWRFSPTPVYSDGRTDCDPDEINCIGHVI